MTNIDYPWEPPLAGTEADHLIGALDRLRTTFRWKADDLDADGLRTRTGASALTLGGLLKHLAICEDYMFTTKLAGQPLGAVDWPRLGRQRRRVGVHHGQGRLAGAALRALGRRRRALPRPTQRGPG
jgi:hypothetical protein